MNKIKTPTPRWVQIFVCLMAVLASLLALGFSLAPPFEGPDENSHFDYISYLYHYRAIPEPAKLPYGAAQHPPLYYLMMTPVIALFGDADRVEILRRTNVMFPGLRGTVGGADNRNRLIHYRDELGFFPRSPTARSVRVIRLISIGLGLVTFFFLWKSFSEFIWMGQPALAIASLAVVIFNPKYLQFTGYINNDNLLLPLCAIVGYLLLKMLRDGWTWRQSLLLGVLLGLGLLNKFNSVVLGLPVGVAFLWRMAQTRQWRLGLRHAVLTLCLVLLTASPWMLFNLKRYGEPTGYFGGVNDSWEGDRIDPNGVPISVGLERIFPYALETYWHYLATDSIELPIWIWQFYVVLMVGGALGLLVRLLQIMLQKRTFQPAIVVLLGVWGSAFVSVLVILASLYYPDNQGRYLFPAMLVWGAALIGGWSALIPPRGRLYFGNGIAAVMMILCGVAFFGYYQPAFDAQVRAASSAPPIGCFAWGGQPMVELLKFDPPIIETNSLKRLVRVDLWWRSLGIPSSNLWEYVHVIGRNRHLVGARDSITGSGNYPSLDWRPAQTWQSTLWLEIRGRPQMVYPVEVGLYDSHQRLLGNCAGRGPVNPAHVVVHGLPQAIPAKVPVTIGQIGLLESQLQRRDSRLWVQLEWVALADIHEDFTVFVQVRDAQSTILAQVDHIPKMGMYPTRYWRKGERITDTSELVLPPDFPLDAQVYVGLYRPPNGGALPMQTEGQTYLTGLPLMIPELE